MPPELAELVGRNGPLLFFGIGFLEFIGAPVAGVPALVAAGALASTGGSDPLLLVTLTAAGGLSADGVLFALARWRGRSMVDAACGLSSNPRSCIYAVLRRVERLGAPFLLGAKFVPGAGNMVAPAAALAGMSAPGFLGLDAAALLLWSTAYTALGWVFADQVGSVLGILAGWGAWTVAALVLLVAAAGVWRILKVQAHTRAHAAMAEEEGEGEVVDPEPPPPSTG
jgi:membrane protein DedA with SNARE-associated domain